jgi:hypothetical protein
LKEHSFGITGMDKHYVKVLKLLDNLLEIPGLEMHYMTMTKLLHNLLEILEGTQFGDD